jgi:hypothetical protein
MNSLSEVREERDRLICHVKMLKEKYDLLPGYSREKSRVLTEITSLTSRIIELQKKITEQIRSKM